MNKPIFLDFQATTPVDEAVLQAMLPWLRAPSNPHSAQHRAGLEASLAVDRARMQVARATGQQSDGVLFTPSATFACNLVIRSFAKPGARIVVSAIEHPCVIETARWCAARGAALDIIPVAEDGLIDTEVAFDLVEGASLVTVMAVNNEVGTVQPIHELATYCRANGIAFHSDGAQALGRVPLADLAESAIITLSSHKAYGPQGIGAICANTEMLDRLEPLITGGGQQNGLQPGTLPTALCVGFGEACALADELRERDWDHARALSDRFLERLHSADVAFDVNGSLEERIPHNLNLSLSDIDADQLLGLLPDLALATGSACSSGAIGRSKVLEAMGHSTQRMAGAVRVGFGRTSRAEEIDEAVDLIAAAIARIAEGL